MPSNFPYPGRLSTWNTMSDMPSKNRATRTRLSTAFMPSLNLFNFLLLKVCCSWDCVAPLHARRIFSLSAIQILATILNSLRVLKNQQWQHQWRVWHLLLLSQLVIEGDYSCNLSFDVTISPLPSDAVMACRWCVLRRWLIVAHCVGMMPKMLNKSLMLGVSHLCSNKNHQIQQSAFSGAWARGPNVCFLQYITRVESWNSPPFENIPSKPQHQTKLI